MRDPRFLNNENARRYFDGIEAGFEFLEEQSDVTECQTAIENWLRDCLEVAHETEPEEIDHSKLLSYIEHTLKDQTHPLLEAFTSLFHGGGRSSSAVTGATILIAKAASQVIVCVQKIDHLRLLVRSPFFRFCETNIFIAEFASILKSDKRIESWWIDQFQSENVIDTKVERFLDEYHGEVAAFNKLRSCGDISRLWRDSHHYRSHLYSEVRSLAGSILLRVNFSAWLRFVDELDHPTEIRFVSGSTSVIEDFELIESIIEHAPIAIEMESGTWNGSIVLPMSLNLVSNHFEQLMQAINLPYGSRPNPDFTEELQTKAKSAFAKLLMRPDGHMIAIDFFDELLWRARIFQGSPIDGFPASPTFEIVNVLANLLGSVLEGVADFRTRAEVAIGVRKNAALVEGQSISDRTNRAGSYCMAALIVFNENAIESRNAWRWFTELMTKKDDDLSSLGSTTRETPPWLYSAIALNIALHEDVEILWSNTWNELAAIRMEARVSSNNWRLDSFSIALIVIGSHAICLAKDSETMGLWELVLERLKFERLASGHNRSEWDKLVPFMVAIAIERLKHCSEEWAKYVQEVINAVVGEPSNLLAVANRLRLMEVSKNTIHGYFKKSNVDLAEQIEQYELLNVGRNENDYSELRSYLGI